MIQLIKPQSLISKVFHSNTRDTKSDPSTLGGVYIVSDFDECDDSRHSCKSLSTTETRSSDGESSQSTSSWNSSGASNHHKGSPRIAKTFSMRRINPNNKKLTEEQLVGRLMLRSRKLPKTNTYCTSNHVMVNNERIYRCIAPLKRIRALDEFARQQAARMAEQRRLFYSSVEELEDVIENIQSGRRIGQNVGKGMDVRAIYDAMKKNVADQNNIIDRRYTCMGMGTAKAEDGTIYLCQVFSD